MRIRLQCFLIAVIYCVLGTSLTQSAVKSKKKREVYSATAVAIAGVAGGSVVQVTIGIDDYTTDEERLQLAQALIEGGSDALRKAMNKMKKGRVSVVGRTGTEVNYIRAWPTANGRRIIMATERPMTFFELRRGTRSRDYEFGFIELRLDEKGRGSGVLIAMTQAQIFPKRFNASHGGHAPGYLRDALLDAIDAQFADGGEWWNELEMFFYNERRQQRWDRAAPKERGRWLVGQLWNSTDVVPGSICDAVDVPMGSSFASLVRKLVLDLR